MSKITNSILIIIVAGVLLYVLVFFGADNKKAIETKNETKVENQNIPPLTEVSLRDNYKGNRNSRNIFIEYSDYQCPACANYNRMVNEFTDENLSKMVFVYRHFPLSYHSNSKNAAYAAESAGQQGKYFELSNMLFEKQNEWQSLASPKTVFINYAKEIGLNVDKFTADLDSKEFVSKVEADYKSGEIYGVNATPTFFFNGKKIEDIKSKQDFVDLLK